MLKRKWLQPNQVSERAYQFGMTTTTTTTEFYYRAGFQPIIPFLIPNPAARAREDPFRGITLVIADRF